MDNNQNHWNFDFIGLDLYNIRKIIFIKAHAFKRLLIIKREFDPIVRYSLLRHGYWPFIVSLKYYYEQSKTIRGLDGWP